jgi:hypothetical protein
MSLDNPVWGATKIRGELLKLGIQVAPVNSFELHGAAGPAVAELEDLHAQSCGGHCVD